MLKNCGCEGCYYNNGKTADEMFEELGYVKVGEDYVSITYRNEDNDCEIDFWKEKKVSKDFCNELEFITIEELKAINKKCEELGWIN